MARSLFSFGLFVIVLLTGCYSVNRPRGIGSVAPDFTVQDADREVTLSQFRGQVAVLNFWASWCPPCVEETPSLVSMQQRLRDKGVIVVAVSIDEDEHAYHRFIKDYGVNFLTVRDPDEKSEHLYGTFKIPESYVIDRNGVLRTKICECGRLELARGGAVPERIVTFRFRTQIRQLNKHQSIVYFGEPVA
jgi:cytochrome c biogenesis protein CcmG/thiol:disulfide interchange protein DsbE